MMDTDTVNTKEKVEHLAQDITSYIDTYIKLSAVKVADKASEMVSTGIAAAMLAVVAYMALLFVALGVSWWIGSMLNSVAAGLGIMGGFFVVLTTVLALLFQKIKSGFKDKMIQAMM